MQLIHQYLNVRQVKPIYALKPTIKVQPKIICDNKLNKIELHLIKKMATKKNSFNVYKYSAKTFTVFI